jgi:hypothetical protein
MNHDNLSMIQVRVTGFETLIFSLQNENATFECHVLCLAFTNAGVLSEAWLLACTDPICTR